MRYLPHTESDRRVMLDKVGAESVNALFRDVPAQKPIVGLPDHQAEYEVEAVLAKMAAKNLAASACPSFLGAGAYRHHVPASVDQLLLRGEFLTSYTPYQPEVSQGTLQYLFEFQSQVALITGMDIANASMYDGATSCAEAVMMANRITQRRRAVVCGNLHPHYRDVVETMGRMTGFNVVVTAPNPADSALCESEMLALLDDTTSCLVVQTPDFFGHLRDSTKLAEACHAKGALLIVVVTEIVSLGLLKPPAAMGADIVACEGQSLGNGVNFGGPHVGLLACRETFVRQMPGRLCGATVDSEGRRGFVLTLSAREQHIRREKATSNICTNSGLCALAFTIHLSLLGEKGFAELAALNHAKACQLAEKLETIPDVALLNANFFNEFTLRLPCPAGYVVAQLAAQKILAGVPVSRFYDHDDLLLVAVTELTTEADMDALVTTLKEACR